MKTIGFTNKFYTLWEVSEVYKKYVSAYEYYEMQDFTYIQNLSFDFETAKSKISGKFSIDLTLKGSSSFTHKGEKLNDAPDNVFAFGKYCGEDIIKINDPDYAYWYYNQTGKDNPVIKQFLLDNGYFEARGRLVDKEDYQKFLRNEHIASLEGGLHFKDGQKVNLEIKELNFHRFKGAYGYCHIVTYESKCGKLFKYLGSCPPDISAEKFTTVSATVKHSYYDGQDETRLQRISIK